MLRHTALALVSLAAATFAADFTTKPAKDAQAAYQKAVQRAEEAHAAAVAKADRELSDAMAAARRDYVAKLEDAAKRAVTAGSVDEAVRIQGEVKAVSEAGEAVDRRTLWVHERGYFQRLHDGGWVERGANGTRQFYDESGRDGSSVRLTRADVVVTIRDDRSQAVAGGVPRPEWSYAGEWIDD